MSDPVGTPVRRSGVKIGEVRSLKLDNDTGKVLVNIQIDEGPIIVGSTGVANVRETIFQKNVVPPESGLDGVHE